MTTAAEMTPLRLLLVEDSMTDAKLVVNALRALGRPVEVERVEDRGAMRAALASHPWDIIVSDWSLPQFSGLHALAIAKEFDAHIPFIVVSGTIGEEKAVEAMRAGAHDYVLKGNLVRLGPAVERELRDSDDRRRRWAAEEALRLSESRFRRLSESGIVGIAVVELAGAVHDANPGFLDMLGYSRDDMRAGGMRWEAMTPPEWQPYDAVAVELLRSEGVAPLREKELFRKDGTRVPVLIGAAMLEPPMSLVFVADLTQRKRAEKALAASAEQLRQAQKMEAVGRLAGGIAHDFNNVLSVILPYAEMLRADASRADLVAEYSEEICQAAERAANLTKQLLMFSRQQPLEPQVLDLNAVISNMEKMLRRVLGEDVELAIVAAAGLGNVRADRGSIEQVIMNLVVNARDAMPTGGKLTIETANAAFDDASEWSNGGVRTGEHVVFAVTDTGIGMDEATQTRIFEPFFTTKERDKGTGLGLSTVFGIVQQSGGSVRVHSEPGKGTTFRVYLPRVTAVAPAVQAPAAATTARGTETILLVEDEAPVRAAIRTILQRNGFIVLEARNGADAVRLCEEHPGPIDLLITDVVMPLMSGPELAERLVAIRPELRVLCMSGYIDDSIIRHGIRESEIAFLQKPITAESLARKVSEVLSF